MFVRELVELLKGCDPNAEVRMETGFDPVDPESMKAPTWHVDGVRVEYPTLWPGDESSLDEQRCILVCDAGKYREWLKANGWEED